MPRKISRSKIHSQHRPQKPVSEVNPAAAGRRRLLRAVAGSGVAVLGGLLTTRWHKPVIESVILPAHAAVSPVTPVSCPVTMVASVTPGTSSAAYGASVLLSGTGGPILLAQANTTGVNTTISGITTLPPGAYSAFFSYTGDGLPWTYSMEVSCCSDASATGNVFGLMSFPYNFNIALDVQVVGDGTCTVT